MIFVPVSQKQSFTQFDLVGACWKKNRVLAVSCMFQFILFMQIKDAYTLRFFENNSSRLPTWCNDGDNVQLPYCQIKGKYRMELPEYNTMDPYPHMNERCQSLPPRYLRSANC